MNASPEVGLVDRGEVTWDAVVVGAGPAGSVTAALLAGPGLVVPSVTRGQAQRSQ